jgi:hypothetical protein
VEASTHLAILHFPIEKGNSLTTWVGKTSPKENRTSKVIMEKIAVRNWLLNEKYFSSWFTNKQNILAKVRS